MLWLFTIPREPEMHRLKQLIPRSPPMEPDTQTFTTTHTGLTQLPVNNEKGEESSDLLTRVNRVSQELDNSINGQ